MSSNQKLKQEATMTPDEFFDELDKLFHSDDGYIKHLERIKKLKEDIDNVEEENEKIGGLVISQTLKLKDVSIKHNELFKENQKLKEQNECLKADMRYLEEQNWNLQEEKEALTNVNATYEDLLAGDGGTIDYIDTLKQENKCQEVAITILKEEKESNKKTILKLISHKKRESKEMTRRLERLNLFEDYVLDRDYATEDFKEYLEAEGYKMTDDGEIVDIPDTEDEVFTDDD